MNPGFREEKKLWREGCKWIAGLDEAGRGCLAGPVVAAAVIIKNPKFEARNSKQIPNSKFQCSKRVWDFSHRDLFRNSDFGFRISRFRDSKKLSPKARNKFYKMLTTHPGIEWGVGRISEKVIDKINIKNAAELAMEKAVLKLNRKPDFLIIDGKYLKNHKLKTINYKLIVKADEKVFSCAAASIIAKVVRDRIMGKYHKIYPKYGFDRHKGYGTELHLARLRKYGACKIHRKSFDPVRSLAPLEVCY